MINAQKEIMSPVSVFYSYAQEDEELRNKLNKHLSGLRQRGLIDEWHERDVQPGTEWQKEINNHINTAHIILLLISSDFISSDYCYGVEMKRALQRHNSGDARVIPIILRPVDWESTPIAYIRVLPSGGKPVTSWQTQDEAFYDVAKNLRKVIEELNGAHLVKPRNRQKNPRDSIDKSAQISGISVETKEVSSVQTLDNQENYRISQVLTNLAERVAKYDWGARVQLRSLGDAVCTGFNLKMWTSIDIYRAIDPDTIVERFRDRKYLISLNKFAEWLIIIRNLLIPMVLVVILLDISSAFSAYDRLTATHPEELYQSFLILWIHGFNGFLPSFQTPQSSFLISAMLGTYIAIITFMVSWISDLAKRRKEREAQKLREEIIDILAEASTYLNSLDQ